MSRSAGGNFQAAQFLELAEGAHQVASVVKISLADGVKAMVIHPGQLMKRPVPVRAMDLFIGQFNQPLEMAHVAILQQRIQQHGAERRGHGQRHPRVHAIAHPALHHLDQRDVVFSDRLEKPVFLKEPLVLRMAHKRQVSVQYKGKVTLHE